MKIPEIKKVKKCLLCKNKKVKKVFSLGNLFVSNFVNKKQINNVMKKLMEKKIQTRTFFYPMHRQKIFKKMNFFANEEKYPNAEYLSRNGFYLPSGLGIKNYEIDYISETLNKILKNK